MKTCKEVRDAILTNLRLSANIRKHLGFSNGTLEFTFDRDGLDYYTIIVRSSEMGEVDIIQKKVKSLARKLGITYSKSQKLNAKFRDRIVIRAILGLRTLKIIISK